VSLVHAAECRQVSDLGAVTVRFRDGQEHPRGQHGSTCSVGGHSQTLAQEERRARGRRAQAESRQYDWAEIARRFASLYEELLASSHRQQLARGGALDRGAAHAVQADESLTDLAALAERRERDGAGCPSSAAEAARRAAL
jgi:hypothetical protein